MLYRNIFWYYTHQIHSNVAFLQATPMDEHGYFNFSVSSGRITGIGVRLFGVRRNKNLRISILGFLLLLLKLILHIEPMRLHERLIGDHTFLPKRHTRVLESGNLCQVAYRHHELRKLRVVRPRQSVRSAVDRADDFIHHLAERLTRTGDPHRMLP